jgi:hypothetical protein
MRQTFEAEAETAALYLELMTDRALECYLNGELVCKLDALDERPPAWRSAGGTYGIDSPVLHLGLNQRLVRRGKNVLAVQVKGETSAARERDDYIAFRRLEPSQGASLAGDEGKAERQ